MKTISRFPNLILLGVVSLGLGAAAIYAIPALATSFGDDVTVSKRLILNSSNEGKLNSDQFQILSGDTPLVRLHQEPGTFTEQIWDLRANEGAMYFHDITGGKWPFLVYTGAPSNSLVVNSSGNVGIGTWGSTTPLAVQANSGANAISIIGRNNGSSDEGTLSFLDNDNATTQAYLQTKATALSINAGGGVLLNPTSGKVIIGPGDPSTYGLLQMFEENGTLAFLHQQTYTSPNGCCGGPGLRIKHANGTKSSPIPLNTSNEVLWDAAWSGYDGTKYIVSSFISVSIDGTPGPDNMPGMMSFWTTPKNAPYGSPRMVITSSGNIGIGTAWLVEPAQKLEVNGALKLAPSGLPANASAGTIYFDATSKHFLGFDGNVWKILDSGGTLAPTQTAVKDTSVRRTDPRGPNIIPAR